nr:hypothetical protein [Chloroflexota bacterium]
MKRPRRQTLLGVRTDVTSWRERPAPEAISLVMSIAGERINESPQRHSMIRFSYSLMAFPCNSPRQKTADFCPPGAVEVMAINGWENESLQRSRLGSHAQLA